MFLPYPIPGKCYFFVLALALTLSGLSLAQTAPSSLRVAVLSPDPNTWPGGYDAYDGPLKTESAALVHTYRLWSELANARGGVETPLGRVPINITFIQLGYDDAGQIAATTQAVASGEYDFFFGPFSSKWSITVAQAMLPYNHTFLMAGHAAATSVFQCEDRPEERPPCTKPYEVRFPRAVGVTPVGEQFLQAPINQLALAGAKTIAGWYQDEDFTRGVATGAFGSALASGIRALSSPFGLPLNAKQEDYDDIAEKIKKLNPDIVVAGSRVETCVMFIKAIRKLNWTPKALLTTLCAQDPSLEASLKRHELEVQDSRFIIDSAVWDPRLKGPEFEDPIGFYFPSNASGSSARLFYDAMASYIPPRERDITSSSLAMAMAYAFEACVSRSNSLDPMTVFSGFPRLLMNSFFGKIGFSGFGQNEAKSVANTQRNRTDGVGIVSPLSAATAALLYPMPTWDDRTFKPKWYSDPSEIIIFVLVALATLFSILMAALTFGYSKYKAILASSPLFLYLMLVGSVMIYAGIITWPLHTSSALCMIHWWLLGIGFILMFGALLVKTWRISRIFNDADLTIVKISNKELLLVVGVAVGIEAALLVIWTAAGRSVAVRKSVDANRPRLDYMTCTTSTIGFVILIIAAVYKALIIAAGVWLSFRTWKVKYSIYNESRWVAFSMYNLFFFLILAIIVQLVLNANYNRKAQFVVRSLMILLGALIPIVVLFLPKFLRASRLGAENTASTEKKTASAALNSSNGEGGNSGGGGGGGGGGGSAVELPARGGKSENRLEQQNKRLKEEVRHLRKEVALLREQTGQDAATLKKTGAWTAGATPAPTSAQFDDSLDLGKTSETEDDSVA